jgi:hypothetical protein
MFTATAVELHSIISPRVWWEAKLKFREENPKSTPDLNGYTFTPRATVLAHVGWGAILRNCILVSQNRSNLLQQEELSPFYKNGQKH